MDEDETLEELVGQLELTEQEFNRIRDENATGSLRDKQQRAENLLDEIHQQVDFLQQQFNRNE